MPEPPTNSRPRWRISAPSTCTTLLTAAALQTRRDRKYLIPSATAANLVRMLEPHLAVLDIDGRRQSSYESAYFDTPALACYFAAAHDRRRRTKVRTRTYVESGTCSLEVKRASARGETIKERIEYPLDLRHGIGPLGRAFLVECEVPRNVVDELSVQLTTDYRRATLLDAGGSRITIDTGLRCTDRSGTVCEIDDLVVLETKSAGSPTGFDRALWASGIRPVAISKYCTGLAAIRPALPANKWNRTLRRHFHWRPAERSVATPGDSPALA